MLNQFANQYPLSKTLKFELKPIGATREFIEKKGLIEEDETRSEDYKKVKIFIDDYHKHFISQSLNGIKLFGLDNYENLFFKQEKDEKDSQEFKKTQEDLRKQIAKAFSSHPSFTNISNANLIKVDLLDFLQNEEDKELVKKFSNFATYFENFHIIRKNLYSSDEKHNCVGYRVIHENLPMFLLNKKVFNQIKENYPDIITNTQNSLLEHLEGAIVEDMFSLDYFSLTLTQRYIDIYNAMIGGKTLADGTKVQGINENINIYRQKNNIDRKNLPTLKPLHKQLLSDRETLSWIPEAFKSKEEVGDAIEDFYNHNIISFKCYDNNVDITKQFIEIFSLNGDYELNKIFIKNDISITSISQDIFKDYRIIKEALWQKHINENPKAAKSKDLTGDEEKYFSRKNSFFSFEEITSSLKLMGRKIDLFSYFKDNVEYKTHSIETTYNKWQKNKNDKKLTKELLDNILNLQRVLKPLNLKADIEKDILFYSTFDIYFESLNGIVKLYNKVRDFESKKPYSLEKFKLNFQNSTLLSGWDVNKEPDNTSILLKKDGLYYLGIMDKKHNRVFKNLESSNYGYEKIEYKLLSGPNKMLPKVFFSNKSIGYYNPSPALLEKYKSGVHKKGESFDLNFCHELIDFFKASIDKHEDWKNFNFKFSDTSEYADISGFYREVEQQGYKITFKNIDEDFINTLVNEGKLYLFQIYNKDFSPFSKGTKNLHTMYWEMLFNEENLKNVVYKLNGEAEIFYRKKSIEYSEDKMKYGHHYEELKDKFNYPIIKDKRFTMDKFQFHVPVTMNFKATGRSYINEEVNDFLRQNSKDIKIIGINRGERHLIYLTMINDQGSILQQYSLNEIVNSYNNKKFTVDYNEKLSKKEGERAVARENWGIVENIKELKEGYLSHVIHMISNLIVENNAIVVLEDLNFEFKRERLKVEKSIYQKFEKMLIDKLNYLVDKKKDINENGGLLKALQLTNKFESFEKIGKQNGFLFFVNAWNITKICPVTGFVNLFDTRYQSVDKAREFFSKFDSIKYNEKKEHYEFVFDYNNFTDKAKDTKTKWTVCSYGTRIKTFRNLEKNNNWDNKTVSPTEDLSKLLKSCDGDIKEFIISQDKKEFFVELLEIFSLIVQMKNSIINSEIDYIISPVANKNGEFFDSRFVNSNLPKNADANAAYNTARKGLMLLEKIRKSEISKKVDMKITNTEWLNFVQER
ncbi:type V CRISPR-associated protein Cas12a/Cpf1 (plasmid) [Aliarcobacter lanthieri]|uniref:type V CRISPR-associated protein Cas12a/Cpf1 n=1 Tax=Aliarcobacter lanthieri TaxID=1355374 RepID=UPI003AAB0997